MVNATGSISQSHIEGLLMFVRGSIYMDYQATTPLAERAFDAMEPFYKEIFGNPHSADHAMGWEANSAVESARQSVSTLIGANVDEVIFTSGATESNNLVFHSVCQTRGRRTKILISSIEHKSVLDSATAMAEMYGLEVVCIPVDRAGLIDIRLFGLLLADDVLIVSVMAVNNEIGTVQDIPLLCKMSHGAGAIFHTDASQAPSAMEVDVSGWGVDLLSLSSHKIYGPKGIGALYVNSALKEELRPLHYGGGQEDGKRAGTISPALCVGFGVAAGLVIELGLEERSMVRGLRELFIDLLLARNLCFSVNGMSENGHPGNISITFSGVDASLLLSTIGAKVCASLGSACSSGFHATSHVLQAVGLNNTQAESTVRFSIGRFTDVAQIESAVDAIDSAVSGILRGEV
jgi:cysteine desulfurase